MAMASADQTFWPTFNLGEFEPFAMAEEVSKKWTLKVSYQQEMRRLRNWPGNEPANFETLKKSVLSLFDLEDLEQTLTYVKEDAGDGEDGPLTSETLHAALEASTAGLLRVAILPKEGGKTTSKTAEEVQEQPQDRSVAGVAHVAPSLSGESEPHGSDAAPTDSQAEGLQAAADEACSGFKAGWARFKEQVVTDFPSFKEQVVMDFKSNYQDMRGAVHCDGDDANRARKVAGQVAGVTAGVCATARLLPLHGTKLAAKSIAAAANRPAENQLQPEPIDPIAGQPAQPTGEVDRFKQQVFQDFETGRSEIQSAFGYLVGSDVRDGQDERVDQRPRIGRDVIPAVASTIAGLTVASTLVPLRVTRLAVASLTQKSDVTPVPTSQTPADGADSRQSGQGRGNFVAEVLLFRIEAKFAMTLTSQKSAYYRLYCILPPV